MSKKINDAGSICYNLLFLWGSCMVSVVTIVIYCKYSSNTLAHTQLYKPSKFPLVHQLPSADIHMRPVSDYWWL